MGRVQLCQTRNLAKIASALAVVVLLLAAAPAGAATRTLGFDDLAPNTRVSTEYSPSEVVFSGDLGIRPVVKPFAGKAHSGEQVGVYTCEGLPGCGEGFSAPQ